MFASHIYVGILFVLLDLYIQHVNSDWVINSPVGEIKGFPAKDGNYETFLGIPYAVLDTPFGPARPHPHFESMFIADDDSMMCPQAVDRKDGTSFGVGTLDCLRLNVYVPTVSSQKPQPFPVLVFIHGGKFAYGADLMEMYGPKYLVRHEIIFVSFNFRQGIYGFSCLNLPEVSGNQGLKDQILALRWIKNNIASFGGNRDSITIMGESSGAKAADLHLHSNFEQLFHRMIMQGGTAYSLPPDLTRTDAINLMQIAQKFGYTKPGVSYELIEFLANLDPTQVAIVAAKYDTFIPCIEYQQLGVTPFLTENPINLNLPKAYNISILIGYTADDQNLNHIDSNPSFYKDWNGIRDKLLLSFNFTQEKLSTVEKIVKKFYLGAESISFDTRLEIGEFESDFNVMHPVERTIAKYFDNGADNVYCYVFSYIGQRNLNRVKSTTAYAGAVHADELGYLFDNRDMLPNDPTPADQLIIDRITQMWTNFAKFGDPIPYGSALLPIPWLPVRKGTDHIYLNINSNLTLGRAPFYSRMAFWDLFYDMYGKYQYGYKNIQLDLAQAWNYNRYNG